jgi:hypothetical protein
MNATAYSNVPPVVRVKDAVGRNVVINLNHVIAVDPHPDRPHEHANVRFSTGEHIRVAMTVDQFWDML